ncbi:MAG: cobalt ECF transporter T component CbiQ, partial [Lachnospiraceae bacterium]|nr:cobalt ECF transporter T component CbiQ [Lachnospiraceae bacterium]
MSSIEKQLLELQRIQNLQQRAHWMNRLHPAGKLLLGLVYILIVVSLDKYDLCRALALSVYPIFGFIIGELSLKEGLYRMRLILPLVVFVGIFNPFFDRQILFRIGSFGVTGGVLSMATLMLKGLYAVLSAYILIATTSIEEICYALRLVHVPRIIVMVVMLIDRYIVIMGQEADRIQTAYRLRAPSQKGIHYKAWGTLVGQWLLRSMDRANLVY